MDPSSSRYPPLQTLSLPHLPPTLRIYIAQYTHLLNAPALLSTSPHPNNAPFSYALIDATALLSPTHLHAAIFRACTDYLAHRLKSRNVHSEIVLSLGWTNNVGGMLKGFGLGAEVGGEVVVVKVCDSLEGIDGGEVVDGEEEMERVRAELRDWVEGTAVTFGEESLRRVCDVEGVRRRYKLGGGGKGGAVRVEGGGGRGKEAKLERRRRRKEGGEGEVNGGGGAGGGEKVVEGGTEVVGNGGGFTEGVKDEREYGEDERRELEMQVLGLMALRGAV